MRYNTNIIRDVVNDTILAMDLPTRAPIVSFVKISTPVVKSSTSVVKTSTNVQSNFNNQLKSANGSGARRENEYIVQLVLFTHEGTDGNTK